MTNPPPGAAVPQDGGSAFPIETTSTPYAPGMSLRDWFAGQNMAAVLSGLCSRGSLSEDDRETIYREAALLSYEAADALLSARGEPK